jgi:hypothetical protein
MVSPTLFPTPFAFPSFDHDASSAMHPGRVETRPGRKVTYDETRLAHDVVVHPEKPANYGDVVQEAKEKGSNDTSIKGQISNWLDSWLGFETSPHHPANAQPHSPRRPPGPGSNALAPDGPSLYYMMCRHASQDEAWLPADERRRQRSTDRVYGSVRMRVDPGARLSQHQPEGRRIIREFREGRLINRYCETRPISNERMGSPSLC